GRCWHVCHLHTKAVLEDCRSRIVRVYVLVLGQQGTREVLEARTLVRLAILGNEKVAHKVVSPVCTGLMIGHKGHASSILDPTSELSHLPRSLCPGAVLLQRCEPPLRACCFWGDNIGILREELHSLSNQPIVWIMGAGQLSDRVFDQVTLKRFMPYQALASAGHPPSNGWQVPNGPLTWGGIFSFKYQPYARRRRRLLMPPHKV